MMIADKSHIGLRNLSCSHSPAAVSKISITLTTAKDTLKPLFCEYSILMILNISS